MELKKIDVLAIGEILADFIGTEYAISLAETRTFRAFQGGSPANLCGNLNFIRKKSLLVGTVGKDAIGDFLLKNLKDCGLDTSLIQQQSAYPSSLVLVSKSKETPDFQAYRLADKEIDAIPTDLIQSAKVVHTTAFALSLNPGRKVILDAFQTAKSMGVKLSCDWNFSPKIWTDKDENQVFNSISSLLDLVKFSRDDYQRFSGKPHASIQEAKAYLETLNIPVICLTDGAQGVWYCESDRIWKHKEAIPVNEVVDTTGAGDAFWAGFLGGFSDELPIDQCVEKGLRLAARKISVLGPLYQLN